jgi:hypothetical protein
VLSAADAPNVLLPGLTDTRLPTPAQERPGPYSWRDGRAMGRGG